MRGTVLAAALLVLASGFLPLETVPPPAPDPSLLGPADVPTWLVGDSWTYETHVFARDGANRTDVHTNLTVIVASLIEAVQDGAYLYLYNSTTSGTLNATGSAEDPGSGAVVDFVVDSGTASGYLWAERGDLAVVRTNQTFTGTGNATVPIFGTQPLAAEGAVTTVNRPPHEEFDFPIEAGDSWGTSTLVNTSGHARFTVDLPAPFPDIVFVQPLVGDRPWIGTSWANGSEFVGVPAGTFEAFRIETSASGGGSATRWYAPNASNVVRLEIHDVAGPTSYTHTWANLTALSRVTPAVPADLVLTPSRVGPGGTFTATGNGVALATVLLRIPATNASASATADSNGGFSVELRAPASDDRTPTSADMGSHGVLLAVGGGYAAATIVLLRPDLSVQGLAVAQVPAADGVPTRIDATAFVTTSVGVHATLEVAFLSEDADLDGDGRMDLAIATYCGRGSCIGTVTIPEVLPGVPASVNVTWTPSPAVLPADVPLSVVVDPADAYGETDERNNVAETVSRVEAPNLTLGNVTVGSPGGTTFFDDPSALGFVSPLLSVRVGELVTLTARPRNAGSVDATRTTVLAFYNTTVLNGSGGVPFSQSSVPPLPSGGNGSDVPATWRAPLASGTAYVNVTVDHGGGIRETDERDNTFVLRFRVYDPALQPDLVPTWIVAPVKASVNRTVTIGARVSNLGGGNASASHIAFYNDTERATPFSVLPVAPLPFNATSSVLYVTWSSGVLGSHRIWIEVDFYDEVPEGNESNGAESVSISIMDVPVTTATVGSPRVGWNPAYIRPDTPVTLSSTDRTGEGPGTIWYRVDSGPWSSIGDAIPIPPMSGGPHVLWYNSTDLLGGSDLTQGLSLFVDDLPPTTTATVTNGTEGKIVALDAADLAVGVNHTEYRFAGDATWTRYTGTPITVTGAGNHTIEFRSVDRLGIEEPVRSIVVTIEPTTGPPLGIGGLNLKPALAVGLALGLLVLGWFESPSPEPVRRKRWVLTVALPPAGLELATGAVSLVVPEMAVPAGTLGLPVDLALFAIGVLVILFSRRRALRAP